MPPTIFVTLRRSQTPVFPDRCAFSNQPCDNETIGLLTRDGLRGRAFWAGWYHIRVPCRSNLKWRVHLTRTWRFIRTVFVGLGSLALAAYVLYPTLKEVSLGLSSLAFTVACLGGLVWWEKSHPPVFNINVQGNAVEFAFLNRKYAQEFAKLNRAPIEMPAE